MPGKNKPKRLDRNRSWRVARRKSKIEDRIKGVSRCRAPRPKHKGVVAEIVVVEAKDEKITPEKKVVKKTAKVVKEKAE